MSVALQSIRPFGRSLDETRQDPASDLPNMLRSVHSSSSVRPQHGAESHPMSSETLARNLRYSGKPTVTLREVKQTLSDALVTKIPQYRVPAKEVAHNIEASEGTVENLRQRGVTDAMARLVLLARHYPAFGAEVRRLISPGADLDPDFQRELADLLRRVI